MNNPSRVVAFGSTDDIRREVLAIKNIYEGNPRLVIDAGCAIPPIAPEENIRELIRTSREL